MAKNKNNQTIWGTRIKKKTSTLFQKVGSSIDIDKRLYKEDIAGSIAHVEMLLKQKIISFKIKNKIVYGLQKIEKEMSKNKFEFNNKYEDIHMNIENKLFQIIGEEAGYIHTARSRNDQVITDFKIWIKSATKEINYNLDQVIKSTIKIAEKNIETIMPGFTHLKNAQPISFAHYLMDLLEYLRGKTGSTFGNLFSMLTILKGLPLSYFKDLQDDKEIVFKSNDTLVDCLKIFNEILKNISPNKKKMYELADNGYITATDLADYLVKEHSMSFRKAYQKTAEIINFAEKNKKKLKDLKIEELKKIEPKLTNDVLKVFDLKNSVNSKKSYGGTSFENIKRMISKYRKKS